MKQKKKKELTSFKKKCSNMTNARFFKVKSSSEQGKVYTVRVFPTGEIRCECPGFIFGGKCKHIKKIATKLLS